MCILLPGLFVIDDSKICYLAVLGYLYAVDEKTCVHSLNVYDTSEGVSDSVWHLSGPFWIIRSFHDVPILLDLACVWSYHRFNLTWLDGYYPHVGVPDFLLLSSLDNCHGWGFWDWHFERRCDFVTWLALISWTLILHTLVLYQWSFGEWVGPSPNLCGGLVDDVCIIWDNMWWFMWLSSCWTAWGDWDFTITSSFLRSVVVRR